MSLCVTCKQRESTGILIHLCDPCFDAWEAEVQAGVVNLGPIDPSLIRESSDCEIGED